MDDVSRSAEVDDHRYGTAGESFEDYACAVVREDGNTNTSADRRLLKTSAWLSQPQKVTAFSIPRDLRELLKAFPFRAVTDHGEPGQTGSQKWSSSAQRKIASLQRNQAANENQLKFGPGSGLRESSEHTERSMPGSGIKNSLSRYTANSAYVWDEAAMIAAAWR